MQFHRSTTFKKLRALALVSVAAIALNACAASRGGSEMRTPDFSGLTQMQKQAAAQDFAQKYQNNPRDIRTTIYYAAALRAVGQPGQAVSVLERARTEFPRDRDVALAFAKALASNGQFNQALNIIDAAIRVEAPHWNTLSVKGAILDQMGRNTEARALYQQAMLSAPNEAGLQANMGLSFAMTGDLPQAEIYLKRATSLPGATGRIRQNLALVIGLQGRFDEARAIYAAELEPEAVESNMAYIRALLTQQNKWDLIKGKK
ncbi:tetratricopeptide repeat protein [Maritalea sp.]|uniref:tetratricopeptide repeat protein n=1 Tax=Maritalea sp. TaxID=2003361 RepID=UPI0039E6735A